MRYNFEPMKKGIVVDRGGYSQGSERTALQSAYILICTYGYDAVRVLQAGRLIATVTFKAVERAPA